MVDERGEPLSYGQAFVRALCRLLSGLILGIGFLIGLFSADGRALHDRIAGTLVAMREPGGSGYGSQNYPAGGHASGYGGRDPAQIVGVTGYFAGRAFPIPPRGLMIGRDQAVCDLYFPNDLRGNGVSRTHCKLQFNPQTRMLVLNDLGSTYGTFLGNGVRVEQGQAVALRSGDEFYLAGRDNTFRVELR